jgi:peroxin-3
LTYFASSWRGNEPYHFLRNDSMLHAIKTHVGERRKAFAKAAGIAGSVYLVRRYMVDRFQEMQDKLQEERVARERCVSCLHIPARPCTLNEILDDSLKRRFDQTQENVSWTVSTHIATLADQILEQMDVDGLTRELQLRSRNRKTTCQPASHPERPPSSLASSVDVVQDHDTRSEAPSLVSPMHHVVDLTQSEPSPLLSTSGLQSWVESSGTPQSSVAEENARSTHPMFTAGANTSTTNGENVSVADSVPVRLSIGRIS